MDRGNPGGAFVIPQMALGVPVAYPLEMERELVSKVRLGDRAGARGVLNRILGRIFYVTNDVTIIKSRVMELAVILSRATADQGIGTERLFDLNNRYFQELNGIKTFEKLCAWVVVVLNSYLDAIPTAQTGRTLSVLDGALAYIRAAFAEPLTLEKVAAQVHVSPYYLAHIMKRNLGFTFVTYLTRTRIEAACVQLLHTDRPVRDIARSVGYADPGYFARVFQKAARMSPRDYRRQGGIV